MSDDLAARQDRERHEFCQRVQSEPDAELVVVLTGTADELVLSASNGDAQAFAEWMLERLKSREPVR